MLQLEKKQLPTWQSCFCHILTKSGFFFIEDLSNTIPVKLGSIAKVVLEEKLIFVYLQTRNKNCLPQACFLCDQNEMKICCRGPYKNYSYRNWLKLA
jgi:hypothetical protein